MRPRRSEPAGHLVSNGRVGDQPRPLIASLREITKKVRAGYLTLTLLLEKSDEMQQFTKRNRPLPKGQETAVSSKNVLPIFYNIMPGLALPT